MHQAENTYQNMGSCVCNSSGMVTHLAHNGRKFLSVHVSENMGHKLGEFFTARFSEVTPHKRALKRHKKAVRKVKRVGEVKGSFLVHFSPLRSLPFTGVKNGSKSILKICENFIQKSQSGAFTYKREAGFWAIHILSFVKKGSVSL